MRMISVRARVAAARERQPLYIELNGGQLKLCRSPPATRGNAYDTIITLPQSGHQRFSAGDFTRRLRIAGKVFPQASNESVMHSPVNLCARQLARPLINNLVENATDLTHFEG